MDSYIKQGDCIELMKSLEDNSVDFTLTDIPYNEVHHQSNGLKVLDKGKADKLTFDLEQFLNDIYRITKNSICIFCGIEQISPINNFFRKQKGTMRILVWQKSNPSPMNGKHVYLSGVEFAIWFKKRGATTFNAFCKNTVFKYPNGSSKLHPTQKNLELWKELIKDNTNEGDIVFDPCMGSGTTAIACLETNRKYIGFELDETFYNVIQERIKDKQSQMSKETRLFM